MQSGCAKYSYRAGAGHVLTIQSIGKSYMALHGQVSVC